MTRFLINHVIVRWSLFFYLCVYRELKGVFLNCGPVRFCQNSLWILMVLLTDSGESRLTVRVNIFLGQNYSLNIYFSRQR